MNFTGWIFAVLLAAFFGALIAKHELTLDANAAQKVFYRQSCDWIPTEQGNRCSLMNTEIPDFEERPWITGNPTNPIWI